MDLGPFQEHARDLAPGDRHLVEGDWSEFSLERVSSVDHPLFGWSYARLWEQFGASGGMERREVIAERLGWDPRRPLWSPPTEPGACAPAATAHALLYEMLVVRRGEEPVAVRDHTAIVPLQRAADDGRWSGGGGGALRGEASGAVVAATRVLVHLSHVLIEPSMRGRGLAGWLRALPLRTARECAAAAGVGVPDCITLAAEMEHAESSSTAVMIRLRSYARAGFLVVDPSRAPYRQPDFRSAAEIDRDEVRPLELALVLRRVGRERDTCLGGAELRDIVASLYAMYAAHVRSDHMAPVLALLDRFPAADDDVALVSPLQASTRQRDIR